MSDLFPEDEDRCADPIDHASRVETRLRENDVALARARSKPEQVQKPVIGPDGKPLRDPHGNAIMYWPITECIDCGDDILEGRLKLGRIRCVICQEKLEKRGKMHGA
jgi:hypothetical protein